MKTLVIYDNTGCIFMQTSSNYIIPQGGVNYLEIEIPSGKYVKSIDVSVSPNVPVYGDAQETDSDKITSLQTQIYNLTTQLINGGVL